MATALTSYIDLILAATYRYADREDERAPLYRERLLRPLTISESQGEPFFGFSPQQEVTIELSNIDNGDLVAPSLARIFLTENPLGQRASARVYDWDALADVMTMNGVLVEQTMTQLSTQLVIAAPDPTDYEVLLPKKLLIDVYPTADLTTSPDPTPPVIVVFGLMRRASLTLVQENVRGFVNSAKATNKVVGTTLAIPVSGGTVGNTYLIALTMDSVVGTVTCTDNAGTPNTYVVDLDQIGPGSGLTTRVCIIRGRIVTATGLTTITITHPNVTARAAIVGEFANLTVTPLDRTASNSGTSTAPSSGATSTTTQKEELIFGAIGIEGLIADFGSVGAGMSLFQTRIGTVGTTGGAVDTNVALEAVYAQQTVMATQTANTSALGASRDWSAAVCTYKIAPAHVAATSVTNKVTGTTLVISVFNGVAGNTYLIAFAMDSVAGTVSCADNAGNTYVVDRDSGVVSGILVRTCIIRGRIVTAMGLTSITITHPSVTARAAVIAEFEGIIATSPLDRKASATGSSTAPSSGPTGSTGQSEELIFGAIGIEGLSTDFGAVGSGMSVVQTRIAAVGTTGGAANTNVSLEAVYAEQTTPLAQTANTSALGTSRDWAAAVCTYKRGPAVTYSARTWDYGAIRKPLTGALTVNTIYRDGRIASASDYTLVEKPTGYYVIRFTVDQRDAGGQPMRIQGDFTSTEFGSNFAFAVLFLLGDSTYGLGKPVDTSPFYAAAADYTALGYQMSGGLDTRVRMFDLIQNLLVHGALLEINSNGEYTMRVDTLASHSSASISLGQGGGYWENIAEVQSDAFKRLEERIKKLTIRALWDPGFTGSGTSLLTAVRERTSARGRELEVVLPFMGDALTADMEADYRFKLLVASDRMLTVTTDTSVRVLALRQTVLVYIPNLFHAGSLFQVWGLEYADGQFVVTLMSYDPNLFTYDVATPVVIAPGATTVSDYSLTPPAAPTNFAVVGVASFTKTTVVLRLEADAPNVNVNRMVFQARRVGIPVPFAQVEVVASPGQDNVPAELTITRGEAYVLEAFARNKANNATAQDGQIAQIDPYSYSVAPNTPTGLVATVGMSRAVSLTWNKNTDPVDEYGVYRHTANVPASAVLIANNADTSFLDTNVVLVPPTTYWYWVTAFDPFENESAKSVVAGPVTPSIGDPTAPSNPGPLVYVSSSTYQGSDGKTVAEIRMTVPAMPTRAAYMNALYSRAAAPSWLIADQLSAGGGTVAFDDLTPNATYNFALQAYSAYNVPSAIVPATGNPFLATSDVTAPSVPVFTAVAAHNQRTILLDWPAVTDLDLSEYRIYRQTLTNFCLNFGFEHLGFADWVQGGTPTGGEAITQGTTPHSGARSLQIETLTHTLSMSQTIGVNPGIQLTVGGWIATNGTGTAQISIDPGNGTPFVAFQVPASTGGAWQFGSATFTTLSIYVTVICIAAGTSLVALFDDIVVSFPPNPTILIGEVRADRYTDTDAFVVGNAYWYAISAVDASENESAKSVFLPATPTRIGNEDLPSNTPLPLTALTLSSTGIYKSGDGQSLGYAALSWTNPTDTKRAYVEVAYRLNGNTTSYLIADQVTTNTARIDDLTPGKSYDFRVRGVSHTGYFGTAATLANQPIILDTTPPAVPTGLVAIVGTGKAVQLNWNDNTESDFNEYGVYRGLTNPPTVQIAQVRASQFVDVNVVLTTPPTRYYYAVSAYDRGEHQSTKCTAVPADPTQVPPDNTPPSNPAPMTFSSDGAYLGSDGTAWAYIIMTIPAMPSGAVLMNCLFKRNGDTPWRIANQRSTGGGNQRFDDLTPGLSYEFGLQAFSAFAIGSAVVNATGSPFVAPGDTTVPAQVTGLTLVDSPPRGIRARWTANTELDFAHYILQSCTVDNTFTNGLVNRRGRINEMTLTGLINGDPYWVRVQAVDFTGNAGLFSAIAGPFTVPRTGTDDYTDLSITNAKIANLTVTAAKIANATITDAQIASLNAGKITAGSLTVANSNGASEILVKSPALIRVQAVQAVPAKIVFESAAGVSGSEISSDTNNGITWIPTTTGGNFTIGLTPTADRWGNIDLRSLGNIRIDASGATGSWVILTAGSSTGQVRLQGARLGLDSAMVQVTTPAAATRRIPVYDASGNIFCYLHASLT